jgi:ParB-like nuclease domain
MQYKHLKQTHKNYNFMGRLDRLCLLYECGYDISNASMMFLRQMNVESEKAFSDRLKFAACTPIMSSKIDYYTALLHSKPMRIDEDASADDPTTPGEPMEDDSVYKLFQADADGFGNSLDAVIAENTKKALLFREGWMGADFVSSDSKPQNELEELMLGTAMPYLYQIDNKCIVDWKFINQDYELAWIKILEDIQTQETALSEPMHVLKYTIWQMENDQPCKYTYTSKPLPMDKKEPGSEEEFEVFKFPPTTFKCIPIFPMCIPPGLAIGEKIGPMCEEIFQRESFLAASSCKATVAMFIAFLSNENTGMQKNPYRADNIVSEWEDKGFGVLGDKDKVEKLEVEGHVFEAIGKMIKDKIELIDSVLNQMAMSVAKTSAQMGRSAASKIEDRHATEIMLTSYGEIEKNFVKKLLNCISAARNEEIVWVVSGRDDFHIIDRQQLILEMAQFPSIVSQAVSPTFQKLYTTETYFALLGGAASQEESMEIVNEVMEADFTQMNPVAPVSPDDPKPMQKSTADSSTNQLAEPKEIANTGHPQLPEGAHLQTGEHIDSKTVYDRMSQDYRDKDIAFVKSMPWKGPVSVPLSSIDNSNMDNWAASQPDQADHVQMFADKIARGEDIKPVILVNNKSNDNKMELVDGHHRYLASLKAGKPVPAFIGESSSDEGPWNRLHAKQIGSKQKSMQKSMQKSNQMNETSQQKAVVKQSNRSAKTKTGKTK